MNQVTAIAPVTCSRVIQINAPSQKVWSVLTDVNDWANWQTSIHKPEIKGELKENATFNWRTGGIKVHSTLHTIKPFINFGWNGKALGINTVHNWTLTDVRRMTEVRVEATMDGLVVRLFRKAFNKKLDKATQKWLELLKRECEK